MTISFDKLHGLGNDFVIIDQRVLAQPLSTAMIRDLADRHTGIGFDQLLLLEQHDRHWQVQIFNADGSSAQQCVNGMRALALWLQRRGLLQQPVEVRTATAGVRVGAAAQDMFYVDLQMPRLHGLLNPCRHADQVFVKAYAVSVGNPHLLVFSDQPLQHRQQMGPAMAQANAAWQQHAGLSDEFRELCRDGCNISFINNTDVRPDHVGLFVCERGSGPTRACGSAACAAAAVLLQNQDFSTVTVAQPGGQLILEQLDASRLRVTGDASHVFTAELDCGVLRQHGLHAATD